MTDCIARACVTHHTPSGSSPVAPLVIIAVYAAIMLALWIIGTRLCYWFLFLDGCRTCRLLGRAGHPYWLVRWHLRRVGVERADDRIKT